MKKYSPLFLCLILPLAACQGTPQNMTPPKLTSLATVSPSPSVMPSVNPMVTATPSSQTSASPDATASPSVAASLSPNSSPSPGASTSPSAAPAEEKLTIKKFPQETSNAPFTEVNNGKGDFFLFWAAANSDNVLALNQARMVDKSQNIYIMMYNKDGALERIQNEKTGDFLIVEPKDESFTIKVFDAFGKFDSGFKITQSNGKYYGSPVLGRPYFTGQLTLDMKGASKTISAVLLPEDENATGQAIELPSGLQTFVNQASLLPSSTQFTVLAATSLSSGYAKSSNGNKLALAGFYAQHLLSGLMSESAKKIASPLLDAGLVAGAAWQMTNGAPTSTANLVSDTGARFEQNKSTTEIVKDQLALINSSGVLSTPKTVAPAINAKLEGIYPKTEPRYFKTPVALPFAAVKVSGFTVDNDGGTVNLTGNVSSTGLLNVSGSSSAGAVSISNAANNKMTAGSYSSYLGNGSYIGRAEALGTCQSQQKSGGQGTYVRAHYMNTGTDKDAVGSGTTVFSYEAFTVPDQFTVFTLDGKKFGTNTLVSGSASANIPVPKNWIVIVSVNAPQDGTAWEYDLTCPLGAPSASASPTASPTTSPTSSPSASATAAPVTQSVLTSDHVASADLSLTTLENISFLYSNTTTETAVDLSKPVGNTPTDLATALNLLLSTGSFTVTELQSGGGAGNGTIEAGDRLNITVSAGAMRAGKAIAGIQLNGGIFTEPMLNMPGYNISGG